MNYESRHTGEELDKAVDFLLDYTGAVEAGIRKIQGAAPELIAHLQVVEEYVKATAFCSSPAVNAVIKEAYLDKSLPAGYARVTVSLERAVYSSADQKWHNRIILGNGPAVTGDAKYATKQEAEDAFSTPVQVFEANGTKLYIRIDPEEWNKITTLTETCTFRDITARDNAPGITAYMAIAQAEANLATLGHKVGYRYEDRDKRRYLFFASAEDCELYLQDKTAHADLLMWDSAIPDIAIVEAEEAARAAIAAAEKIEKQTIPAADDRIREAAEAAKEARKAAAGAGEAAGKALEEAGEAKKQAAAAAGQAEYAKKQADEAQEQARYAKEQAEYAKEQAENDHNRAENDHNSLAGGIVTRLDKHVGMYSKSLPVTLGKQVATGKMLALSATGEVVEKAQAGWAISRINAEGFTFGDTVFLKMVDAQGNNLMVEGAVLFAAEEQIKDKEGRVITTRLTSLFRASNTDIPESGYVIKTLGIKGKNLLISHPSSVTSVEIGRSGVGASMATLEANLQESINEKANMAGVHLQMVVGGSRTVVPDGTEEIDPYTELVPAGRVFGDGGSLNGQLYTQQSPYSHPAHEPSAVFVDGVGKVSTVNIEKVMGEVVGGQQIVSEQKRSYTFQRSRTTPYTQFNLYLQVFNTHRYISFVNFDKNQASDITGLSWQNMIGAYQQGVFLEAKNNNWYAITPSIIQTRNTWGLVVFHSTTNEGSLSYSGLLLLDLTTLFPTPSGQSFVSRLTNNKSSAVAVANRLGYTSLLTYDD